MTIERTHLRDLDEERPGWREEFRMVPAPSTQQIEVAKIVGSVGHGRDFSQDWLPFAEGERDTNLLESMRRRGFDPEESNQSPISLLEYCCEYFVEGDGHRRVSAAHRLNLPTVKAEVFKLEGRREPAAEAGDHTTRGRWHDSA